MRIIAITGGIGAGKSTVAHALSERGAILIDGDKLARRVVDVRDSIGVVTVPKIRALLGDEAFAADGTLDRAAVASRVFTDAELRASYNRILFPAIEAATIARIAEIKSADPDATIVHEIPLYTGRTLPWTYDYVVTVEAAAEARISRLVEGRGYSPEHARDRILAQGAEAPRAKIADLVIRTDTTMADTIAAVEALWRHTQSLPHTQH